MSRLWCVAGFATEGEGAGDGAGEALGLEAMEAMLLFRGVGRAEAFFATGSCGAEQPQDNLEEGI
jgi:hypothetical protein